MTVLGSSWVDNMKIVCELVQCTSPAAKMEEVCCSPKTHMNSTWNAQGFYRAVVMKSKFFMLSLSIFYEYERS